jgi:hypothetical protein
VPLTFGIDSDRVPAPLQHQQAVSGDQETGVHKLLFMLQVRCVAPSARADESLKQRVSFFVKTVREFMERRTRERPVRLQVVDPSAVHLLNCKQGQSLEPRNGEIARGVRLHCGPFTGDAHQRWLLYPVGANTYRITTLDGTKCLSIQNDSAKSGAAVILWDYVGHPSQHWLLTKPVGEGGALSTVSLVNAASDCLLSSGVDTNDVVQANRANVTNEDWWILLAGKV